MEKKLDVSVIIVNWNTRELLRQCLESIRVQTRGITYETIVVDNASVDQSATMVKVEYPEAILIENTENRGFAAANNQGIRISTGRYVLLLNSDTLVLDRAITRTVEYSDQNVQYGVVGCQVWEDEFTIQETCFNFHTPWNVFCVVTGLAKLFPRSVVLGGDKMRYWDRMTEREVEVVSGMFMLVRCEAVDAVGLLDEHFFIYCEEADWCFRLHQAGWKSYFWPGAKIIHRDGGGKSTAQVNVKMEVQKVKSLLFFIRKHYGVVAEGAVRTTIVLSSLVKIVVLAALWPLSPERNTGKIGKFVGIIRFCATNHVQNAVGMKT
jgi:GT2 family glycosyltransferase